MDQRFIVMMIPHHRMGVMMASMAQNTSQHLQLKTEVVWFFWTGSIVNL